MTMKYNFDKIPNREAQIPSSGMWIAKTPECGWQYGF